MGWIPIYLGPVDGMGRRSCSLSLLSMILELWFAASEGGKK